ncbi:MAG: hypothetical protein ACKPKO_59190, partial [Candidatus Fonsibacter sp.]
HFRWIRSTTLRGFRATTLRIFGSTYIEQIKEATGSKQAITELNILMLFSLIMWLIQTFNFVYCCG